MCSGGELRRLPLTASAPPWKARRMSLLVDFFRTQLELAAGPLVLIDAGVSGGIDPRWRQFGPALRAIGFDPLVHEVRHLTALEEHSGVEYHAAFLTGPEDRARPTDRKELPFERSSAASAASIMMIDYKQTYYNAGQDLVMSSDRYSIDQIQPKLSVPWVDVIKIDTDGVDFLVLCGAEQTIEHHGVLAVQIEVEFQGSADERSNTFANIDRYLRRHGFRLFGLEVHRYSRAALPSPFVYRIPAQTTGGQVEWGDAVYLRDPVGQPATAGTPVHDLALLRLACLYDVFGFPDCSAELLTTYRSDFSRWCDIEELLDQLTPTEESYRQYIERFKSDPTLWYPGD